MEPDGNICLIAGAGEFPALVLRELKARNLDPLVIALDEEAPEELVELSDRFHRIPMGKVGKILKLLKSENITGAIVAGKVHKARIFKGLKLDIKAMTLLWALKDRKDDTIMEKIAGILAEEGVTLLPQTAHMDAYLPGPQTFTSKAPTDEELEDVDFGKGVAKDMGGMDIGQSVVVKRGAVLAVEAIEGTDAAILRGGSLGGNGVVVVKAAKPEQDLRFDVPAIGLHTVYSCIDAGASVLAIEGGKTFFFQREEAVAMADRHGLSIVAF